MTEPALKEELNAYKDSNIERTREEFLAQLLRELTGAMQDFIGINESKSFFSMVGDEIGRAWNEEYKNAVGADHLSVRQIAAALVDLKARIGGDFKIVSIDRDRIVLRNAACPFRSKVFGRKAMCQITSSIFGRIVADNLGYARVDLQKTIADGDGRCDVTVHLDLPKCGPVRAGDEYYRLETRE